MIRRLVALALAVAAIGVVPSRPAPATPAAARDWTRVVNRNAAGAFVMGNPAAPVKLVEYLSFTCSHCAHFSAEGLPALEAGYVRSGRVSVEFRHALRDPYDFTSALLARCGGPAAYTTVSKAIFAAQGDWLERAAAATPTPGQTRVATARSVGLDAIARNKGIADARQAACLANQREQRVLAGMAEEAWQQRRIPGTPAFLINGQLVDGAAGWEQLEPALRRALGSR